jgi:hypothetical protein
MNTRLLTDEGAQIGAEQVSALRSIWRGCVVYRTEQTGSSDFLL